jgi:hypothetical protein
MLTQGHKKLKKQDSMLLPIENNKFVVTDPKDKEWINWTKWMRKEKGERDAWNKRNKRMTEYVFTYL